MTITAPVDGELLDPAWAEEITDAINNLFSSVLRTARKSSDQALATSSTTLQNVTGLVLPVEANTTYIGLLCVGAACASGTTEDVKYAFTFPSGTLDFFNLGPATSITSGFGDAEFSAHVAATSGVTSGSFGAVAGGVYTGTWLAFRLAVGSTAGNLQLQAAQNTSGGNAITIRLGSFLALFKAAS